MRITNAICRKCGFTFEVPSVQGDLYQCPNCDKIHSLEEMYFCVKKPVRDIFADQSVQIAKLKAELKEAQEHKDSALMRAANAAQDAKTQKTCYNTALMGYNLLNERYGEQAKKLADAEDRHNEDWYRKAMNAESSLSICRQEALAQVNELCIQRNNQAETIEQQRKSVDVLSQTVTEWMKKANTAAKVAAEVTATVEDLKKLTGNQAIVVGKQRTELHQSDAIIDRLRSERIEMKRERDSANHACCKMRMELKRFEGHTSLERALKRAACAEQLVEELEEKCEDSFYDRKDEVMGSFAEMLNKTLIERDEKFKALREENRQLFAGLTGAKHTLMASAMPHEVRSAGKILGYVVAAQKEIQAALDGQV